MSQPTPIFTGHIIAGQLKLTERDLFLNHLNSLEGKPVQITVEREKRKRSNNQNRWYFGVILKMISDHTGQDVDSLHMAFKYQFSPKVCVGNLVVPQPTRTHDTIDFGQYCEKVRQWAAEFLQLSIPDPNEIQT